MHSASGRVRATCNRSLPRGMDSPQGLSPRLGSMNSPKDQVEATTDMLEVFIDEDMAKRPVCLSKRSSARSDERQRSST